MGIQKLYANQIIRLQPGLVLDIGCGIGRLLEHLPDAVGIDHNPHSIGVARQRSFQAFTVQEFRDSKLCVDQSFDSILLAHVLEHLTPLESLQLITSYLALLKPQGKLIIVCPQEAGYRSDETHTHFLDFSAIEEICRGLGFEIESQKSFPFPRFMGRLFRYNEFIVSAKRNRNTEIE